VNRMRMGKLSMLPNDADQATASGGR
jgi:hypothetical protein